MCFNGTLCQCTSETLEIKQEVCQCACVCTSVWHNLGYNLTRIRGTRPTVTPRGRYMALFIIILVFIIIYMVMIMIIMK